jgi:hypothetical protein
LGQYFDVVEPDVDRVFARAAHGSVADVDAAVRAAHAAFSGFSVDRLCSCSNASRHTNDRLNHPHRSRKGSRPRCGAWLPGAYLEIPIP